MKYINISNETLYIPTVGNVLPNGEFDADSNIADERLKIKVKETIEDTDIPVKRKR